MHSRNEIARLDLVIIFYFMGRGHMFEHLQSDNFRGELPGVTYETIFPATKLKAHEKSVTTLVSHNLYTPWIHIIY